MTSIVDKRFTMKDGSIINRQKFIDKYKAKIKDAIKNIVDKGTVKDFKFKDQKIRIKTDDDGMDIPNFEMDPENGVYQDVSVGNKKFKKGDRIAKPRSGQGSGNKGSKDGGGEDSFEFTLSDKEFADLFFEDLELPELVKKQFTGDSFEIQRAGFSNTGGPSSLSVKQTIIRAFMRKFAIKKQQEKEGDKLIVENDKVIVKPKKKIHFLEDVDLKYNYKDKVELPSTKAVMFALMDVSGSMGETEKDIAKRFFILLNMFLQRNYDQVEVVFVRHAEWAEECSEEVFFHGRESGGTVISAGYEEINKIISARYNSEQWNIYISQATDGDNFEGNNNHMVDLLTNSLLPKTQYYAYIEIAASPYRSGKPSEVYQVLDKVSGQFKNLAVKMVKDYNEIIDVFRSLFAKGKS